MADRIALRLERADLRMKPDEWVLLRACTGLAAVAVAPWSPAASSSASPVGSRADVARVAPVPGPPATRRRSDAFEAQLPDTLQLVASSLRTGFSLPQAVDAAAQERPQPMAGELTRALAEARLGAPLEDALDRVAERMDSQDLHWTVMAIRIQREVGGNLAEVLHDDGRDDARAGSDAPPGAARCRPRAGCRRTS